MTKPMPIYCEFPFYARFTREVAPFSRFFPSTRTKDAGWGGGWGEDTVKMFIAHCEF